MRRPEVDRSLLVEIDRFDHQQILQFIQEKAMTKTIASQLFIALNFGILFVWAIYLGYSFVTAFNRTLFEFIGALFLIPFWIIAHECIHGLAYKSIGAKRVVFEMDIRRFMFMTLVYDEVFSYKALIPVILAPAIMLAFVPIWIFDLGYPLLAFTLFTFHFLSIGGDYYLIHYYHLNKHKNLYTEDLSTKESVIYALQAENNE